jgi:hypothetical protein
VQGPVFGPPLYIHTLQLNETNKNYLFNTVLNITENGHNKEEIINLCNQISHKGRLTQK